VCKHNHRAPLKYLAGWWRDELYTFKIREYSY
jgi:hypothetical protein